MIRPMFNLESPKFARASTPTESAAQPDMTSPAASGRHLLELEKMTKNAASEGLAARRFACPTNWWASCYTLFMTSFTPSK